MSINLLVHTNSDQVQLRVTFQLIINILSAKSVITTLVEDLNSMRRTFLTAITFRCGVVGKSAITINSTRESKDCRHSY